MPERTQLRRPVSADAKACGRICFDAFTAISSAHNFPPDFPSPDVAAGLMAHLISHPRFYGVVAEHEGEVVGSNFLDERSIVSGVGPITVSPTTQNAGVGRMLMQAVLDRTGETGAPGVRLLQASYHSRSLSLYTKLGFRCRESLACIQGEAIGRAPEGYEVRAATNADIAACNDVCRSVHGHDRAGEVVDAIEQGTARVVEHGGRISGYATGLAFFAHAVGETNRDLWALIAAAQAFEGPGILVPIRNTELFQACLDHGLRVQQVMTLMTIGLYNEPQGAWLPSIWF